MTDIASLKLAVDSTEVKTGVAELDKLTAAGKRTTEGVGRLGAQQASAAAAMAKTTAVAGSTRAGMQQLGFQINDVATQFAMGTKASTIFAQQSGQVIQALSMMSGGASKFATFMGGPWGIAITAATVILVPFIARMFDVKDAANIASDALAGLINKQNQALANANKVQNATLGLAQLQAKINALPAQQFNPDGSVKFAYGSIEARRRELTAQLNEGRVAIGQSTGRFSDPAKNDIREQLFGSAADRLFGISSSAGGSGGGRAGGAGRVDSEARKRALEEERKAAEDAALMWSTLDAQIKAATASALSFMDERANEDLAGTYETVGGAEMAAKRIQDANDLADAMDRLKNIAGEIDLGSVFGNVGSALDGMVDTIERMTAAQEAYETASARALGNEEEMAKASKIHKEAQLNGQLAMLSASKKLFSEQSTGYKIISAAEKALAALRLVNTIKSIVMDTLHTKSSVANSTVRATADQGAGASKMFSQLGVWAFPAVAAMIAILASLGVKGGGSASAPKIPTAEELQDSAGTGSVLGDSKAKSNSIANSLEIVASNTNSQLEYSNQMLAALQSIDAGISKLAGNVAQQIGVSGSMFDTSKLNLGSSGSGGFLGMFASSTQRELWDAGMKLVGGTVGDIVAEGIKGETYQIVQQVKKNSGFFGIGGGTKTTYETTTGAIDPSITSAIQDVIISLRGGLIAAADVFGIEGAAAIADSFRVELGTLSFKDMTGTQIEEQLNAIFSKVGDDMAGAILPSLAQIQLVGEGLFETFTRAAREYQVVDIALRSIGMAFGMVGVESINARDNLVQLLGGLDKFSTATSFYRDNFLTEAERMAPVAASVAAEMERLNLAGVDTIDAFKAVVNGLDLTTQAGRELYAALMGVAPAFAAVEKYQQKQADDAAAAAEKQAADAKTAADKAAALNKTRLSMEATLMEMTGDKAGALAIRRALELQAMDESLRGLQMQIYAQQDVAAARNVLNEAYSRERGELTATAAKFRGFADSLRVFRASLYDGSSGAGSYSASLAALRSTGSMAALGSESAIGELPGVARNFLDVSRGQSKSLVDYKRDVARVAGYVDRAISGASGMATAAEQQLAALDKSVEGLLEVNESVVTVEQAIADLRAVMENPTLVIADTALKAREEDKQAAADLLREVASMRDESKALNLKTVENTAAMSRFLARIEAAGVRVFNDNASPIYTTAAT